jgi:ubiquinone/menaquinone biosynthesis C-methylase UbiE
MTDRAVVTARHGHGPAGNVFDKYHTKNPVYRALVRGFLTSVRELARSFGSPTVLEVGCGEGHLARVLQAGWSIPPIVAFDISPGVVSEAVKQGGGPLFHVGDSCALPFADKSFDLVVMCEVMEHIERPEDALAEICRVARRGCLVSVPREPLWRALNLLRGSYLRDWGNTPGHVQWWTRRSFVRFLSTHGKVVATVAPLPWTVALLEPPGV